jgi:hypothetical protein
MLRMVILFAALAVSCASHAADSCAVQAVHLISQGKTEELTAWFKAPSVEVARGLEKISLDLGHIDEVFALAHQSPGTSVRTSIVSSGLPSKYSFEGSWAMATSEKLGRVEFQASVDAGSSCKLLALHVHKYLK